MDRCSALRATLRVQIIETSRERLYAKVQSGSVLAASVALQHLSDLGESVKDVVEDFVEMNAGVVFPPVSIQVFDPSIPHMVFAGAGGGGIYCLEHH